MNDLIISNPGSVSYDFEAARAYLKGQLDTYRGVVFTEDSKKDAKNTVAQLRKEKKAFADRVKELKAEYLKPFDDFFYKACELMDMYDEPINYINEQIDIFERSRIEAKKKEIFSIYDELVFEADLIDIIPIQKIYNPKWENATFSSKSIKEEIMERKLAAKNAISTIKAMNSEKEEQALMMYKRDFDLSACIVYLNDFERQKREIIAQEEERLKKEAEERIRAEERAKIQAEIEKEKAVEQAKAEAIEMLIPEDNGEEPEQYSYILTMVPGAKEKLELFMNSIGIEFIELPM